MGVRSWFVNWLEAGRTKKDPDRMTESYPFPYGVMMRKGNNQPAPKRTPTNLRKLSESPIPRAAINIVKKGITKLNWSVTAINEHESERYRELCKIIERSLLKPNQGDTFRSWIEQLVEDMLVCSAGSSEVLRAGDPLRPFRMYPVDTFSVDLYPEWDGKPSSYRYAQRVNGQHIHLKSSELMYIRMNPRSNTPFGLSPLEIVWESVEMFISAHRSAGKQTSSAGRRKLINLGEKFDAKAIKAFREFWEHEIMGRGIDPIIGSGKSSVHDLGATDDKALFLEWQRFLIEIVAISFEISPKKLGQTKDVNRSTADSEDEDTKDTVQNIAENIVEHINNHIIDGIFGMGGVLEFKFHYETSLKDRKLKADIDAIYLDRRVVTPDEVRDEQAKRALPNGHGEVLLVPGKTTVVNLNEPDGGQPQSKETTSDPPSNTTEEDEP